MNAGTRAEQAYEEVKRLLMSGSIIPGLRLDPSRIADAVSAGVTPVREALLRLAGERVVEMRKNTGFHMPVLTEAMLVDLYRWNFEILKLALASPGWKSGEDAARQLPAGAADGPASLFAAIGLRSGRPEIAAQIASANDRLTAARTVEVLVLGETGSEIAGIAGSIGAAAPLLTAELRKYHSRRLGKARALVSEIYKISETQSE